MAGDPESYVNVSTADLIRSGSLKAPQPAVAQVPWPAAGWTFAPLGYRPVDDEGVWAINPEGPIGLPLMMAGAKAIAGQRAMFWIVPISVGVLVLVTARLGERLDAPRAGLIAAWLVATSPVLLYSMTVPVAAVPAAALVALVVYFLLGSTTTSALAAGVLTSLAIIVRPGGSWRTP